MSTIENPSWHSVCRFFKIDPEASLTEEQIALLIAKYRAANGYDG